MTKYNGLVSNFIQGVSQQPEVQRLEGQVTEQINCVSSVLDGLIRRPCSEIVNCNSMNLDTAQYYEYSRGDGLEKYLFVVIAGVLYVYDLETGIQQPVTQSTSYLNGQLNFCTVKDTTFVVNTERTTSMTEVTPYFKKYDYLIYAKKASYGITYNIDIKKQSGAMATVGSITTDSTVSLSSGTMNKQLSLNTEDDVIRPLYFQIVAWLPMNSPTTTVIQYGNLIHISANDPLNIVVNDGNGDTELFCVHEEVEDVTTLPNIAPHGHRVKVLNRDQDKENDYYLEFITDQGAGISIGHWKETYGDNYKYIDKDTMPHKIVRESNGSFTVDSIDWIDRNAGDDITNPIPSFIDEKILAVLVYQNRLVLSTSNTICASCTDDYYNFFAPSVIESAATDPIDATSSGNKVTDLRHMFVFNGSLIIVGRESQYIHSSDIAFDSSHFALVPKINYLTTLSCEPRASADNIYLPYSYGRYTGIRTLGINDITNNVIGTELTDYVNNYLKGTCEQIEVTANHSTAFIRTLDYNGVYIYQWYQRGDQLLQQAWHKWEFPELGTIRHISIIDNYLYIISSSVSHGFIISKLNIKGDVFPNSDIPIHLDYVSEITGTEYPTYYDVTLPDTYSDITNLQIVLGNNFESAGKVLVEHIDYEVGYGNILILKKENLPLVSGPPIVYVGFPFTSSVLITNPTVKDFRGKAKLINKLKLERIYVKLEDTGYISINVTKYNNTIQNIFNGKVVGSSLLLDREVAIADYLFNIPVRDKIDNVSIEFFSDSYLPFNIISMAWIGTYKDKGRGTL